MEDLKANFVSMTFVYEQLESLEREYKLRDQANRERSERERESNRVDAELRPLATLLSFNHRDLSTEEILTALRQDGYRIFEGLQQVVNDGWDGSYQYKEHHTSDWSDAAQTFFFEIIMALKATKGACTVMVPEGVKSALTVWGTGGIVYRDENPDVS